MAASYFNTQENDRTERESVARKQEKESEKGVYTDEPRIAFVIERSEGNKVVVESLHWAALRKDGERSLNFRLVTLGNERAAGPAVRTDPAEMARQVVSSHGSHHPGNFLIRSKNDHSYDEKEYQRGLVSHDHPSRFTKKTSN